MRILGATPRAAEPAHHNKIIDQIADNLAVLEESGLFDEVFLCSRAQELLFPLEGAGECASDTLRRILFGPWTAEEERHYRKLQAKLDLLKTE